uniref:Lipocalin n=1 Tax=Rhipicephalus appendiculatus TaxID=34631 RepID=A0A131YVP8_RHIAP
MILPVTVTFVFGAVFVAYTSANEDYEEHAVPEEESYPINQFLNKTEDIWILNTTQEGVQSCRKDKNWYMTPNATYFYRSYEENGKKIVNKSLVGYFGNYDPEKDNSYNLIDISYESNHYKELLAYSSDDGKCGVFKVFDLKTDKIWREVRIVGRPKESTTLYKNCTDDFEEYVKVLRENWTSPYAESCQ